MYAIYERHLRHVVAGGVLGVRCRAVYSVYVLGIYTVCTQHTIYNSIFGVMWLVAYHASDVAPFLF
jgi:hypothetical protein